jgi:ectoine hydroxylase-related dioxygenase (phytanoyl-CoA dioxygenase family)
MLTVDQNGIPQSNSWLDKIEALYLVYKAHLRGDITTSQVELAQQFNIFGYLIDTPPLEINLKKIDRELNALWRLRPHDVPIATSKVPSLVSMSKVAPQERQDPYRIADIHSWSEALLDIALSSKIHETAKLLLGEEPIIYQSLFFERGSQQPAHRDPCYVMPQRPDYLLGVWIALEDVSVEAGPLFYYMASHRLPYYRNSKGQINLSEEDYQPQTEYLNKNLVGLPKMILNCKKGQVLYWHRDLVHGGCPIENKTLTRKSLVLHFTAKKGSTERLSQVNNQLFSTRKVHERYNLSAFQAPSKGAIKF